MNVRPYTENLEGKMRVTVFEEDILSKLKAESEVIAKDLRLDVEECLEFLRMLYVAAKIEQIDLRENDWIDYAKTHAEKLLYTFGSVAAAKKYINRYHQVDAARPEPSTQLIHDACLFSLPSNKNWNPSVWQKILVAENPSGPENDALRLLSMADKIERYIANHANLPIIKQIVEDEIKKDVIVNYKKEYKDICANEKRKLEQGNEIKLSQSIKAAKKEKNKKDEINEKRKSEHANEIRFTKNRKEEKREKKKKIENDDEFIQAIKSEDSYIAYKLLKDKDKTDRLLKSTIKAKLSHIIPLSEKISLPLLKKIATECAYARAKENPEAAALFFQHNVPEEKFNLYLSLKPHTSHEFIPNVEINGSEIKNAYEDFVLSKIDSRNPEAAILGKLTNCCQWLGGAGETCAMHGILDPRGGFYVLRHRESNAVIAQCWAWRSAEGNIVFDSIEIALNSRTKHKDMIVDFFSHLAKHLVKKENIPQVIVGKSGETPGEMHTIDPLTNNTPVNYYMYRDSKRQTIVAHRDLPFLQPGFPTLTKSENAPYHIDRRASILWCDIAFQAGGNWNIGDDIALFELSKEEFEERTRLSQKWRDKIYRIDEPETWEILKPIADKINLAIKDDGGNSALAHAIRQNAIDVVTFLIEELIKTDPLAINYCVNDAQTAVELAMQEGNIAILRLLHKYGARFDETILLSKHAQSNLEVTQFLIEEIGADITKVDLCANTVLKKAEGSVLQYLINYARSKNVLNQLIIATPSNLINIGKLLNEEEFIFLVREAGAKFLEAESDSDRGRSIGIIFNMLPQTHHAEFINMLGQNQLLNITDIKALQTMLEDIKSAADQCQLLKLIGQDRLRNLISRSGSLVLNYELSVDAKILLLELLGNDCLKTLFANFDDFKESLGYIKETSAQGRLLEIMGKEKLQTLCEGSNESLLSLVRGTVTTDAQIKLLQILEKENVIKEFASKLHDFNELLWQDEEFALKCLDFLGSDGLSILYQNMNPNEFHYLLNELQENIQFDLLKMIGSNLQNIFGNDAEVTSFLKSLNYKSYFLEMVSSLHLNINQVIEIIDTVQFHDYRKPTEAARIILEKTAQQFPDDPKIGLIFYLQGKSYSKSDKPDLRDEAVAFSYFEQAFTHLNLTSNTESWETNNAILGDNHEEHILGLGLGYISLAHSFVENGDNEKAIACVERAKHCCEYLKNSKNSNIDVERLSSAIEYFAKYNSIKLYGTKHTMFNPVPAQHMFNASQHASQHKEQSKFETPFGENKIERNPGKK